MLAKFIKKAKKIHGNKYDYSLVNYKNRNTEIEIICPEHGSFIQRPYLHIKGRGCSLCGSKKSIKSNQSNTDEFVEKANKIHNNRYDYSLVNYVNAKTKIEIICPNHGKFMQMPCDHLKGRGCCKCGRDLQRNKASDSFDEFVRKAKKIHNNKYIYDKFKYTNNNQAIKIKCPSHGIFKQTIKSHLRGKGCPQCGVVFSSNCNRLGTDRFIEKANKIHNNKYDYSLVNYVNALTKIEIICPNHGRFMQIPNNHLRGHGCMLCPTVISRGHQEVIDYLSNLSGEMVVNDRTIINPYELDIYLPKKKIAIEYHGLFYHSYNSQETINERNKHSAKYDMCEDKDIQLIQIFENEWFDRNNIVKSTLKHKIGMTDISIGARECEIVDPFDGYNKFMDNNHMQGHRCASVKIGLKHGDDVVSCMTFAKHNKYQWEVIRFANKLNHNIMGGASKIFRYFIASYEPDLILTFADRRYSNGNLYRRLGFKYHSKTNPNYFYIKHGMFSRQQFQKHKLHKKLAHFDKNKTESQNMFDNGYRRLWDAGHHKFIWRTE